MSENREFAREYRSGLARELLKEQEREERRRLLEKARLTLDYRLARAEKRALSRGVDFLSPQILRQRELQEESPPGGMESHFVSNEGSLYKLFPYLDG
ncbi:MAG: hypothetical protein ACE5NM_04640, partial [Sedimentisphaerales bacterium]